MQILKAILAKFVKSIANKGKPRFYLIRGEEAGYHPRYFEVRGGEIRQKMSGKLVDFVKGALR